MLSVYIKSIVHLYSWLVRVCVCVYEERERERGALFIVIGGFSFYYCDTNTICNLNKTTSKGFKEHIFSQLL